jgi:hypothetical protein
MHFGMRELIQQVVRKKKDDDWTKTERRTLFAYCQLDLCPSLIGRGRLIKSRYVCDVVNRDRPTVDRSSDWKDKKFNAPFLQPLFHSKPQ